MRIGGLSINSSGITWGQKSHNINRSEDGSYLLSANSLSELMSFADDLVDGAYSDYNLIQLFHSLGEVFAPIDEIARRIASAIPQLRKIDTDEVVYDNDPMNKILERPNPLQNFQQLIYEWVVYELVTGKNMLYANVPDTLSFNYKNISALWNLPAYAVEMVTNANIKLFSATEISDIIKGYRVQDGMSSNVTISPEKVLLSKQIDLDFSNRKLQGKSPLLAARKAIKNLLVVYAARHTIYVKRGALGFLVSKKSDESGRQALTKPEKDQLTKDWQDGHGVTGKGKSPIAITNLPVEYIRIAMSIQELQPFEETEQDAALIYAVLGVPRELMPKTKENTYANKVTAGRDLYNNICIAKAESMYQSISNFFRLRESGFYLFPSFNHIEVLQENKKEKADTDWRNNETYRMRFLHGIISLNQWRTAIGEEEVKGGLYDKLLLEMTPEELAAVKEVISIKGAAPSPESNPANPNQPKSEDKPK